MYVCVYTAPLPSYAALPASFCTALPHVREHTPLHPFPPADPKAKSTPKGKVAVASKILKHRRSKAFLDGEEDDLDEEGDEEGDVEEAEAYEEYVEEPFPSKKRNQYATRKEREEYSTMKAKEQKTAQAKWKAAKAKGNTAVIMRLDDTDEAIRESFRRVKEAYDRLPPSDDDDEYSNDLDSGQKRKRKGKKIKQMSGTAHAQLSAKLSAYARLATHDVSHIPLRLCLYTTSKSPKAHLNFLYCHIKPQKCQT